MIYKSFYKDERKGKEDGIRRKWNRNHLIVVDEKKAN
jgi:hypothetical protein